jgi:hypothetical protein
MVHCARGSRPGQGTIRNKAMTYQTMLCDLTSLLRRNKGANPKDYYRTGYITSDYLVFPKKSGYFYGMLLFNPFNSLLDLLILSLWSLIATALRSRS